MLWIFFWNHQKNHAMEIHVRQGLAVIAHFLFPLFTFKWPGPKTNVLHTRLWSYGCRANCWFGNQLEDIATSTHLPNRDHGTKCPNFRHSWSNNKSYRINRWLSRYPEFSKVPWTRPMQDLIEVLSSWKRHDHIDVVSLISIYVHFIFFRRKITYLLNNFQTSWYQINIVTSSAKRFICIFIWRLAFHVSALLGRNTQGWVETGNNKYGARWPLEKRPRPFAEMAINFLWNRKQSSETAKKL